MPDADLVEEFDAASHKIGGLVRLSSSAASDVIHEIASAFVVDASTLRWWESLKSDPISVQYGGADGLAELSSVIDDELEVYVMLTDESPPPWAGYRGRFQHVIAALRECRFFEYLLVPCDLSWLVFDTHMNELLMVGRAIAPKRGQNVDDGTRALMEKMDG